MYWLSIWQKPNTDEIRLYINGTSRQSVYFKLADDGRVVWSSKANDTPPKYRTGDHYGKVRKDREAACDVAAAFNLRLGEGSSREDWDRIVQIARDGIQVEPRNDDDA